MNVLEEWSGQVSAELGIPAEALDVTAVLDLARDVAHGVARPAAPLTSYLLGVAVGQGVPLAEAAARVRGCLQHWPGTAEDN